MARRSGQIPLDDEPMDIDLGDLPSEEEFAEAEAATTDDLDGPGESSRGAVVEEQTLLGLFQTWVTLVVVLYFVAGWAVGALFAFGGAAGIGLGALAHPAFYLIVLFWPIALWQMLWNQL